MSPTPPHHPTYNVRLSDDRVRAIVCTVFPACEVTHIKELESGKSYNNRIYFVDILSSHGQEKRSFVLKLAGHFFDFRKIENELGCLQLFQKYCPELPVPEPFAWSASGEAIETVDGRTIKAESGSPFSDHAWIMTSRAPGRVLTIADLETEDGVQILKQLARYLTMWRTQIPKASVWGNLRIQTGSYQSENQTTTFEDLLPDKTFKVDKFLFNTFDWPNTQLYYPTEAQDQLGRVKHEPQFARTRSTHIVDWEKWVKEELPRFPICQQQQYTLTHFDFSPRNVLVTRGDDGRLKVTAILDFEFTGFFPAEEEFLNAMVRQEGDWEEKHWNVIMQEMARLGQKVPPTPGVDQTMCIDEKEWKQARIIAKVVDRIAPWEIMDGKFEEEELQRELDEAAAVVEDGIMKLRLLGPSAAPNT